MKTLTKRIRKVFIWTALLAFVFNATFVANLAEVDAASTGYVNPDTSDEANYTNSGWEDPEDVDFSDNQRSDASSGSDIATYGQFDFSEFPEGVDVTGIEVRIEGYTNGTRNVEISLSHNAGVNFTLAKTANLPVGTSVVEDEVYLGGENDSWGRNWSVEDLSSANFKVRLDATTGDSDLHVDELAVRVHYSENVEPEAPELTAPQNHAFVNSSTPLLDWEAAVDENEDVLTYQVQIDETDEFESPQEFVTANTAYQLGTMADGTYYWRVRAMDENEAGEWSLVWSFTIDTIGPRGTYDSIVDATNPTTNNNPEVSGKFYDDEIPGQEVEKIEVVFNNGTDQFVKSTDIDRDTDTYTTKMTGGFVIADLSTVSVLPDGTYKVSAFAYDEAGNPKEEVIVEALVIDTEAPLKATNLTIIQKTPTSVTLKWDKSVSLDVAGYIISYGTASGVYSSTLDVGNVSEYTVSGLTSQTAYYFAVKAYDKGMNISQYSNEVTDVTPQAVVLAATQTPAPSVKSAPKDGVVESAQAQEEEKAEEQPKQEEEKKEDEKDSNNAWFWFIIIGLAVAGGYYWWTKNPNWYKNSGGPKPPQIG